MNRSKKIVSTALVSLVAASGLVAGSSTSAGAAAGNRVIVSEWGSYDEVLNKCLRVQSQYASMRVRITKSCEWIGQTQQFKHGFAFYWTQA